MKRLSDLEIVFISDKVKNHSDADGFTTNLEVPEEYYFDEIFKSVSSITDNFYHYFSPKEFQDNIHKHKNSLVLSIWAGENSRSRKSFVPAICEVAHIAYFGADSSCNSICQDKILSKEYARQFNINSANYDILYNLDDIKENYTLNFPVVIKPVYEGGSIGISSRNIAYTSNDTNIIAKKILKKFSPIMIEEYIEGYEVSLVIFGNKKKIHRRGITKVVIGDKDYFKSEIWGYEDKKSDDTSKEILADHLFNEIPWTNIDKLFYSFDKLELIRIDARINKNGFYLLELSPDAYLGSDGSVGIYYTQKLNFTIKDMIVEFLENSLKCHQESRNSK